ncbi:hypothetical protein GEMRC1_003686 [Eukaryota sp. GEM-RC1]
MYQQPNPQYGQPQPYMGQQMGQPMMQQQPMQQSYHPQPQMHAPMYTVSGFRNLPRRSKRESVQVCDFLTLNSACCTCCCVILIIIIAVLAFGAAVCASLETQRTETYTYDKWMTSVNIKAHRGDVEFVYGDFAEPKLIITVRNNRDEPLPMELESAEGGNLFFLANDGASYLQDCFTVRVKVELPNDFIGFDGTGTIYNFNTEFSSATTATVKFNSAKLIAKSGTATGKAEFHGTNTLEATTDATIEMGYGSTLTIKTQFGSQTVQVTGTHYYTPNNGWTLNQETERGNIVTTFPNVFEGRIAKEGDVAVSVNGTDKVCTNLPLTLGADSSRLNIKRTTGSGSSEVRLTQNLGSLC